MTDVLVAAEHRRGALRDVTYEAITAGRELADAFEGNLHVAVVGGDVDGFAEDVNREGVDAIHAVADGEEFDHNAYQAAVSALADRIEAGAVVLPNSVNGLDYAPALAEDLGVPIATDAVGLDYDDGLTVTREMYGSKVETTVDVAGDRFVLTVRGGEWPPAEGVGDATVEAADVDIPESGARVTGFEEVGGGDVDIADADVLVSVGRGIEEEENLELVEELADALGATLSASRPIVDSGWLPKNRQVGQSGKVVTPDVYIAIGISGAVQHVAGMKGSDTIVAINTDPNAPIFDIADYGIVGDLFDVVPELIDEFA
jgi:electron transfer flavoprotein alpha subunit